MEPLPPLKKTLEKIKALRAQIEALRPLNAGELEALKATLKVEFTHHSTAIEGNTLSLGETKLVLEEGLTIGGKSLREIHETANHNALFELLYHAVKTQQPIDLALVFNTHQTVLKNIDDENAGTYRKIQVHISGEEAPLPPASQVPPLTKTLLKTYTQETNPVLQAANFHYDFVKIHPFTDGNGRTVRILMNVILLQAGYPLMIIPKIRRGEYIQTLNSASSRERFIQFFADVLLQNMKDYLRMLNP